MKITLQSKTLGDLQKQVNEAVKMYGENQSMLHPISYLGEFEIKLSRFSTTPNHKIPKAAQACGGKVFNTRPWDSLRVIQKSKKPMPLPKHFFDRITKKNK